MSVHETEVLIIGGGVLGAAVARELSKYKVDVTLVEKEVDFGWGITKANAALVCQGMDCLTFRKEYYRSKLVWESIPMMEPLCKELDVPFKRIGQIAVFRDMGDIRPYSKVKARQEKWIPQMGSHQVLDKETLRNWEPNISRKFIGALYDPVMAITDPVKLNIALAENAEQNGVKTKLGTEVVGISPGVDEFEVQTNNGNIKSRFIVNAAGEQVDKIAAMVNADDFVVFPIKAQMWVLDKNVGGLVNHCVFAFVNDPPNMNLITPTVDGNLLIGVQLLLSDKRGDHSTSREAAERAIRYAQSLVPAISERDIIKSFASFILFRNLETGWHECIVRPSNSVPGLINVSIGFPGVSAAPATAKELVRLLSDQGLKLVDNPNFNPHRKDIPDFSELSNGEKNQLIVHDSRYAHVVCRCETVTEGEIVEAIKRIKAVGGLATVDGVKHRVRAGMGRCQSGFCRPRVISILANELGIPEEEVTMVGGKSRELLYKNKELLEEVNKIATGS